jgi:hypothetical protein
MRQRRREATASDSNSPKVNLLTVLIKPVSFTLFRCCCRLKHASAPPQSYGQELELSEGTSPRELPCLCADEAGNI